MSSRVSAPIRSCKIHIYATTRAFTLMVVFALAGATPAVAQNPPAAKALPKMKRSVAEAFVLEDSAVVISLRQLPERWRPSLNGKPGFYSWRINVNAVPALSIVLAADTMMRVANLEQVVGGSTLRRCADPAETAALRCTIALRDTVGVRNDFVQIVLRDTAIVSYFRELRPGNVETITLDPHGRFHIDRLRISFHDVRR